jgi:hypothetical protein
MEATYSYVVLVNIYQITRYHIPEHCIIDMNKLSLILPDCVKYI